MLTAATSVWIGGSTLTTGPETQIGIGRIGNGLYKDGKLRVVDQLRTKKGIGGGIIQ